MMQVNDNKRKWDQMAKEASTATHVKSLFSGTAAKDLDPGVEGGVRLPLDQKAKSEAGLKINEAYARRFEHNKKREELQRCELAKRLSFA